MGQPMVAAARPRDPFREDDGGFTTLSVAVAMLLVLALVFSAAQVRWVQSESPDIQFAADAGALAAENVVSKFYVVSRTVDAVLLSISLVYITMLGISIVLCCIPATVTAGTQLMSAASRVSAARSKLYDSATAALDALQTALPLLCASNAVAVISRNSEAMGDHNMMGIAIPVPLTGEDVSLDDGSDADEAAEAMEESNEELSEHVTEASEIAESMDEVKRRAWLRDCGDTPDYCMYERASTLAGLSGASNPYYSSYESWSFSVALERARAYYSARLSSESPESQSLEELVRSACRERFYAYAVELLRSGYVTEGEDGSFAAEFPLLPANTSELKETSLYTDSSWPVSTDDTIHGTSQCPDYLESGRAGTGSLSELDAGTWQECGQCQFDTTSMGRVGAASSSIDNGFEYHYRQVAQLAEEYESLAAEYVEASEKAKEQAQSSLDSYAEALSIVTDGGNRYDPSPPGRSGCIAIVVDTETHEVPSSFISTFVGAEASIGPRMAVSGAALAKEEPADGQNVISELTESLYADALESGDASFAAGALDGLMGVWGGALQLYSEGVDGLVDGVEDVLDSIPGLGDTPLGSWAAEGLVTILDALDLEPIDLSTPRPVNVNTIHIVAEANGTLSEVIETARGAIELLQLPESLTIEGLPNGSLDLALPDLLSLDESIVDAAKEMLAGSG